MKKQSETQSAVTGLKIKTSIKSGRLASNHNQNAAKGLKVRTNVRAGRLSSNHNQILVCGQEQANRTGPDPPWAPYSSFRHKRWGLRTISTKAITNQQNYKSRKNYEK